MPAPSAVIEIDEVFDARMHSGVTTFSMRCEQLPLGAEVLHDRFDHELRHADVGQRHYGGNPRYRGIRIGAGEPAFGHQLVERFRDALLRGIAGTETGVVQLDAMPVERGDLRDARAHRAGADDGDRGVRRQRGGHRVAICARTGGSEQVSVGAANN